MENEQILEEEQNNFGADDYINQLNEIRSNTVSKADYNKLAEDNKRLMNALANGERIANEEKPVVDIEAIRKSIFSPDTQKKTNLQYFTEVLTLRDALIERGEKDPFLPFSSEYRVNDTDIRDAERIAEQIRECVEYADGDPSVFNVELQRRCGVVNKKFR